MLATKPIAQGPIAASGSASYRFNIQSGTYALSMHGAGKLITDIYPSGSYLLNGRVLALSAQRPVNIDAGLFILEGQDVTLKQGYGVVANNGSYALTGQDLLFDTGFGLLSDSGTFSLTGHIVNLSVSMNAENAEYFLIIEEAPKKLSKASRSGSFTLIGKDANVFANRNLHTVSAGFTYQGKDVRFLGFLSASTPQAVYSAQLVSASVFTEQAVAGSDEWEEVGAE